MVVEPCHPFQRRPSCTILFALEREDGPAVMTTPVVGSPLRRTGAAIELMPDAYTSCMEL